MLVKGLSFFLMFMLATPGLAEDGKSSLLSDEFIKCAQGNDDQGFKAGACANAELVRQDEKLAASYAALLAFVDQSAPPTRKAYVQAQTDWTAFRESNCASQNQQGGAAQAYGFTRCKLDMTVLRIIEIQYIMEDLKAPMPPHA